MGSVDVGSATVTSVSSTSKVGNQGWWFRRSWCGCGKNRWCTGSWRSSFRGWRRGGLGYGWRWDRRINLLGVGCSWDAAERNPTLSRVRDPSAWKSVATTDGTAGAGYPRATVHRTTNVL